MTKNDQVKISIKDYSDITNFLNERKVSTHCPRCPAGKLYLAPEYFALTNANNEIKVFVLACGNCGFIAWHAANSIHISPESWLN